MSEPVERRYLEDASGYRGEAERVCVPSTGAEMAALLAEAAGAGIPVTIAGAGTGLTGGRVAHGGWVLSLEKFTTLAIEDGLARAGSGVALQTLHDAAARAGQMYPPDPTEWTASVGGTIATNASGSRSFRYGATRRWIRALTVATMDGRLRAFRRGDAVPFDVPALRRPATTKNTAGYALTPGMDWIDLFTGSEGTLGVVTEAELALLPVWPGELITGVVFFGDDEAAVAAVDSWRAVDGVRMLEYCDAASLELLRTRFPETPAAARAALLIEQEAAPGEDEAWLARLENSGAFAEESWFATGARDRERFRRFRHALPELVNDTVRRRGFTKLGSDYVVPLDRNLEMLRLYRAALDAEFAGRYVIFGHIGDAHVHVNILPASQAEFDRGRAIMVDLAGEAVRLGGTVSAEHGLGKRKAGLLPLMFTPEEIDAMRAVKRRLDPQWLLGRGTLFK
ncbi:MAG: FAD-binding oxidoreductase [Acidobacteria bacterium]|nr:FAD-binding oxidoreductase [Acidobacteriota bacterium]